MEKRAQEKRKKRWIRLKCTTLWMYFQFGFAPLHKTCVHPHCTLINFYPERRIFMSIICSKSLTKNIPFVVWKRIKKLSIHIHWHGKDLGKCNYLPVWLHLQLLCLFFLVVLRSSCYNLFVCCFEKLMQTTVYSHQHHFVCQLYTYFNSWRFVGCH